MKLKIDLIFEGFRKMGCTAAVVSAFGCGAFGNPPDVVARLFKAALIYDGAGDNLREVVFSIFDDHNSRRWHNPDGNFLPFKHAFEDMPGNHGDTAMRAGEFKQT